MALSRIFALEFFREHRASTKSLQRHRFMVKAFASLLLQMNTAQARFQPYFFSTIRLVPQILIGV